MNIKYALLGLLSRKPCSGYDLKKQIVDSSALYWSGNNNQIYTTLVLLHEEGLVDYQIDITADLPAKKVYKITETGLVELKKWLCSSSDLPELRNDFLIKLEWVDLLEEQKLSALFAEYEEGLRMQMIMEKEKARRTRSLQPEPSKRAFFSSMVAENIVKFYENELMWLHRLRDGLASIPATEKG